MSCCRFSRALGTLGLAFHIYLLIKRRYVKRRAVWGSMRPACPDDQLPREYGAVDVPLFRASERAPGPLVRSLASRR